MVYRPPTPSQIDSLVIYTSFRCCHGDVFGKRKIPLRLGKSAPISFLPKSTWRRWKDSQFSRSSLEGERRSKPIEGAHLKTRGSNVFLLEYSLRERERPIPWLEIHCFILTTHIYRHVIAHSMLCPLHRLWTRLAIAIIIDSFISSQPLPIVISVFDNNYSLLRVGCLLFWPIVPSRFVSFSGFAREGVFFFLLYYSTRERPPLFFLFHFRFPWRRSLLSIMVFPSGLCRFRFLLLKLLALRTDHRQISV